jgi:predicted O-methyltransferase YrrM
MTSIIISGCDSRYFPAAQGLVHSIRRFSTLSQIPFGFLDFGLEESQRRWLSDQGVEIKPGGWDEDFPSRAAWEAARPRFKAYVCRPHLPRHFPDYEVYLWLDADAWVQRPEAVSHLLEAAGQGTLAASPQVDRNYGSFVRSRDDLQRDFQSTAYCLGEELAQKLVLTPSWHPGVFAMHRNAPHWDSWRRYLQSALGRVDPNDDAARLIARASFNAAIYLDGYTCEQLPCTYHWLAHLSQPYWEVTTNQFVEVSPPHAPIGILHLSRIPTGQRQQVRVSYRGLPYFVVEAGWTLEAQQALTAAQQAFLASLEPFHAQIQTARAAAARDTDYVSPGLARVAPDTCFPHMVVGDKSHCLWNYLRREVPHRWYVDRRFPNIGFLNRDEAHILYNIATQFRGRRALEVGCWMGWSTCHLALAGVTLDVIDPVLADQRFRKSVSESLAAAQVLDHVNLVAGASPQAVHELAQRENRKWSLFFIDGAHDGAAPRNDTVACEQYAEPDSAFVFHDLVCPDVAAGLRYLKERGWNTRVYQTMQIMGMAWRGNVTPLDHVPDPSVAWTVPEHLREFPFGGAAGT